MPFSSSFAAKDAAKECNAVADDLERGSYAPGLLLVVPIAEQAVRDNFTSSATPDNVAWAPRKVVGDGHPLLMDRGPLVQASTGGGPGHIARVFDQHGEVGVDLGIIPYARAQNFGRPEINLPARENLGMRENRQVEAGETLADWTHRNKF